MTPVQIAYFKHYLFDKGIQAIYISSYRKNRIKGNPDGSPGNPESLERFLQEQPFFRVVMNAFYFQMNSDYNYDYWDDINKKWKKYWSIHEDNFSNDKYVTLKGTFGILRQNWDKDKYWIPESMEDTYKRMNMQPPIESNNLEKDLRVPRITYKERNYDWNEDKHKFKVGDIIQGTISGEVLTVTAVATTCYMVNDGGVIDFDKEDYWELIDEVAEEGDVNESEADEKLIDVKDFSDVPEAQEQTSGPGSLLEGFSLVSTNNPHGGRRLPKNVITVNLRNRGYRITFPTKVSENLRKHTYEYVNLLTKADTREIALSFNHNSGSSVTIKKSPNSTVNNVTINSKEIVEGIHKFYEFGQNKDYFLLEIVNTIYQTNSTTFILKLRK